MDCIQQILAFIFQCPDLAYLQLVWWDLHILWTGIKDVLWSRKPVYAWTQATLVAKRQDKRKKKETKQKQRNSVWSPCDKTVASNRINNKYFSWAYSPSIKRQKQKEYDQKSHAFLCSIIQVKAFSFRQLNKDHLFWQELCKDTKVLPQRRRDSSHKK